MKFTGLKFVRKEYLPGAYFYRALNGWILSDLKDAQNWLTRGSQKFTDHNTIYIYRVIPTEDPSSQIIDESLPAKSVFTKTLAFLNSSPTPSYSAADLLGAKLRQK